ncbi:MAG: FAD-binding oxidoreductase [Sphingopyxis sp.]|nr:FAD-binding oxidoreductase [Sphingopyxis sp.]
MKQVDVMIVGGGIAGASLAAEVAPHASVAIIEMESQPGYHATGRSAAFWSETYGGPAIQPLTTASGDVLEGGGFLQPLGAIQIGKPEHRARLDTFLADFAASGIALEEIDPREYIPGLREDWVLGVREPTCAYIDVAGLHAACIGAARKAGAEILTRAELLSARRVDGGWEVETGAGPLRAGILVNAAGAWADPVARLCGVAPIGITPYQRTLVQLRTDPGAPEDLPHVASLDASFYFKPEPGGRIWLSPHDETEVEPGDVAPEELDVAIAIDRFENVVDWRVAAVERKWAGLRSFAPDRKPVYGFAPDEPAFFWCAGQGGFGIQTAPAAARVAASLLLGSAPHASVAGIDPAMYRPERFSA